MSESLGSAVLELSTDNAGLEGGLSRGLGSVQKMTTHAGEAIRGMGTNLTLMALPLIEAGREGVKKLEEMQQANLQTRSVVKSLGATSHITAGNVQEVADSLGNTAAINPQLVQSGENLLLTLGKFPGTVRQQRREFGQASLDMMNYAARLKVGPDAAAKALERSHFALGKGVLQVGRIALAMTPAQQKLAQHYEKTGNEAGLLAIRHEILEKRMGGAAAAAGGGLAGNMFRLKEAFEKTAAAVVSGILPQLQQLFHWITEGMHAFQGLSPHVQHLIGMFALVAAVAGPVLVVIGETIVALGALMDPVVLIGGALVVLGAMWLKSGDHMKQTMKVVEQVRAALGVAFQWIKNVGWPAVIDGAKKAMDWYQQNVAPTITSVIASVTATLTTWFGWAAAAWAKWGSDITAVVKTYFDVIKAVVAAGVKVIGDVIKVVLAVLRGDWSGAWASLKAVVSDALHGVINIVKALGPSLLAVAKLLWSVIKTAVPAVLGALGGVLVAALKGAWNAAASLASWLLGEGEKLGKAIIDGVVQAIESGASAITGAMEHMASQALSSAKGALGIHSPSSVFRDEVGLPIMQGIAAGISLGLPGVIARQQHALQVMRDNAKGPIDQAKQAYEDAKKKLAAVKSLKADFIKYAALEKSAADRTRNAEQRVKDAEAMLAAARKTKSKADDAHAANALKNAKESLATERAAVGVSHAQLVADAKLAGVSLKRLHTIRQMNAAIAAQAAAAAAAQAAADQAQADADAADAAAQAAIDTTQAAQDALTAGLDAIKNAASEALNYGDLQDALNGGPTVDTLTAKIATLKDEYNQLADYLATNAASLSTDVVAGIYSDMAGIVSEANDTQDQITAILTPPPSTDTTTTDTTSSDGSGAPAVDPYAAQLQIIQQFSSEPDMFAASRSAAFAYSTAGLVGG